jgi:hypothetical protein
LALVAYSFTIAIYAAATGASTEATNLSVAIVDEDHSDLSRRIADGLTPPTFKPAVQIAATEIDPAMNSQRFIYVVLRVLEELFAYAGSFKLPTGTTLRSVQSIFGRRIRACKMSLTDERGIAAQTASLGPIWGNHAFQPSSRTAPKGTSPARLTHHAIASTSRSRVPDAGYADEHLCNL